MNSKRQYYNILPTNLGAGVYAPSRNGLSQIIFEIPQVPAIMNGKSLRLNGTFKVFSSGSGATAVSADNTNQFFSATPTNDVYIDSRTGVLSAIETLTIGSLRGTTYTSIKNYNRLMSSVLPLNESTADYLNGVNSHYGCFGKDVTTAGYCDKEFDFSVPLHCGYLQGQPINMWIVQGQRVTLTLAQDNFVIHNNKQRNDASTAGDTSYYQISNVSLSFEVDVPDEQGQQAIRNMETGVMTYNSYSSFYNVVVSSDHTLSLLFNTAKTISVIGNMIPSEWMNNIEYDSSRTMQLLYEGAGGELKYAVPIESYTYTVGGVRIPIDAEIDTEIDQQQGTPSAYKDDTELNAIREGWNAGNFVKCLESELSVDLGVGQPARFDPARPAIVGCDKMQQFNLGLSYDHITNIGQDCRTRPFGLRIQSQLPSGQTFKPHSLFLYVLHQCTIAFDKGNVQVYQ